MNSHGLTKENILVAFPKALAEDPSFYALAQVVAGLLEKRREELGCVALYPQIGEVGEKLADILAHDFKVDWWDNDYSLEEKRRTLQSSWQVHKTLGTKAAVEKAISAVFPHTTVEEWFQYGGEPYHFRLHIDLNGEHLDKEKQDRVMDRVGFYKNLRSHLDEVGYFSTAGPFSWENWATRASLLREIVFPFRVSHGFPEEYARLDGKKLLDGTWNLGQPLRTNGLRAFGVWLPLRELSLEPRALEFSLEMGPVAFRSPQRPAPKRIFLEGYSFETGEAPKLERFGVVAVVKNRETAVLGWIPEGEWIFDGGGNFDGRRTMDGPVIHEIL